MNSLLIMIILNFLKHEEAINKSSAISIYEFPVDDLGVKINTIQKIVRKLAQMKLIEQGYKDGHAFTYYITEKGLKVLDEES